MNYKQEMYIEYIIQGYNHRNAYLLAFPEAKGRKPSIIDQNASILFHKEEVQEYFLKRRQEQLDILMEKSVWTKEKAIGELMEVLENNKKEYKRLENSWVEELALWDKRIQELEKEKKKCRIGKKKTAELDSKIDECRWQKIQLTKRFRNSKFVNDGILQSVLQLNGIMENFRVINPNNEEDVQTQLQILFSTDMEKGQEVEHEESESGTIQD